MVHTHSETQTVERDVNRSIPNMHHRDICATVPHTGSLILTNDNFHIHSTPGVSKKEEGCMHAGKNTSTFLPSNSAGPTPTIIMDMGRDAACKTEQAHQGLTS